MTKERGLDKVFWSSARVIKVYFHYIFKYDGVAHWLQCFSKTVLLANARQLHR